MNHAVTSREAILAACRGLVREKGLAALSMRAVAARCHVALGSLYDYYPSKEALTADTVGSVWEDILRSGTGGPAPVPFPDYVEWLFRSVRAGAALYPGFFADHSAVFSAGAKGDARRRMEECFGWIRERMLEALRNDPEIPPGTFGAELSEEDFVAFVWTGLQSELARRENSCAVLREIVRRAVRSGS